MKEMRKFSKKNAITAATFSEKEHLCNQGERFRSNVLAGKIPEPEETWRESYGKNKPEIHIGDLSYTHIKGVKQCGCLAARRCHAYHGPAGTLTLRYPVKQHDNIF